jgi:hypothetical protein
MGEEEERIGAWKEKRLGSPVREGHNTRQADDSVKKPRASARGFFQRKSQYDLKGTGVQNYTAIPARSSERGILAFSREAR